MATNVRDATRQPPRRRLSWNDPSVRGVVFQILALLGVAAFVGFLVHNTVQNLESRNIASGFGFLNLEASFGIGETMVSYSPASSYARAFLVGVLNTLRVAVIGIILATIFGTLLGIARLSRNWLIAKIASVYVEVMRNLPLLLQLFFWYALITESLPGPRQALQVIPDVFVSNRGVRFPVPVDHFAIDLMMVAFVLALLLIVVVSGWAKKRQDATGQPFPMGWTALGLVVGLPLVAWVAGGAPTALDAPRLKGFNFEGGATMSPEFTALLVGLVTYTAAFIAEIVRSGILAVSHGQTEAARALGLQPGQTLRLVVLPQALRVIVPPMTSQYLNITKNSSLAVAIGYPDVVSIANTTLNQTGQAIEGITMIMVVFLTISLSISLFMNWYNKRIALTER